MYFVIKVQNKRIMNFDTAHQATTAGALAAAYARRELTPTQVAERCLARAQAARGVFTQLTASRALAQAERATARWRAAVRAPRRHSGPVPR